MRRIAIEDEAYDLIEQADSHLSKTCSLILWAYTRNAEYGRMERRDRRKILGLIWFRIDRFCVDRPMIYTAPGISSGCWLPIGRNGQPPTQIFLAGCKRLFCRHGDLACGGIACLAGDRIDEELYNIQRRGRRRCGVCSLTRITPLYLCRVRSHTDVVAGFYRVTRFIAAHNIVAS
jgi:hypothetical protein